eukprot:scpid104293/ scgid27686/ 
MGNEQSGAALWNFSDQDLQDDCVRCSGRRGVFARGNLVANADLPATARSVGHRADKDSRTRWHSPGASVKSTGVSKASSPCLVAAPMMRNDRPHDDSSRNMIASSVTSSTEDTASTSSVRTSGLKDHTLSTQCEGGEEGLNQQQRSVNQNNLSSTAQDQPSTSSSS